MKNTQQNVAIDIEVLRDWKNSLIGNYIKQIGDWEDDIVDVEISDLWKHFKFPQYVEILNEKDENGVQYEEFVESYMEEDMDAEYLPNEAYFNEFMLTNVLEIFGHAKEREANIIHYLNEQQKADNEFIITLFSTVKGKAKAATLFFLSKYGCEIDNIKFIKNNEDLIGFDKIITKSEMNGKLFKELDFRSI